MQREAEAMNKQLNKTLILTGWSKTVYMTAAAAALTAKLTTG